MTTRKVDTDRLVEAADTMTFAGREISQNAGGVDRFAPPVPDDVHGLQYWLPKLDEARQAFDERLGGQLEQAGGRLATQSVNAAAADTGAEFAHLPAAGH